MSKARKRIISNYWVPRHSCWEKEGPQSSQLIAQATQSEPPGSLLHNPAPCKILCRTTAKYSCLSNVSVNSFSWQF